MKGLVCAEPNWSLAASIPGTLHRPSDAAVPPLDKLHAFRLTDYREVALLDSDTFVVRALDDLFGQVITTDYH